MKIRSLQGHYDILYLTIDKGGLGSAVAEVLCEEQPAKLLRIGVEDHFGESGSAVELIQKYGLDAEGIVDRIRTLQI